MSDAHDSFDNADRDEQGRGDSFSSAVVDRMHRSANAWNLPGGQLLLPRVFGFCRGVRRALTMLERAVADHAGRGGTLVLLGQIIHNPWVNAFFADRGVRILTPDQVREVEKHVTAADGAVVPAFGVPWDIEQRLTAIGCRVIDTSCGDVRRLWVWTTRAVEQGYGVLIYGRVHHDETVVTCSRLAAAGGSYVVTEDLDKIAALCQMLTGRRDAGEFSRVFDERATNARSIEPFYHRLAQVSQTTMLYDDTMTVRGLIRNALTSHTPAQHPTRNVLFEPTVCRATQQRQAAAVELCAAGVDLVMVVGGFGSSNTRHLYELARKSAAAWFIEDARAIVSAGELSTMDIATSQPIIARDWLPPRRPLKIGVLAGASSPEIVVGQVLERLAQFLG
ncbi:MAG: hypothetical protein ABFD92_01240 [Planctomycetaceae bacterium]|nr:hypothetical protein [Planctomycetaceae bacterium]